MHPFEEYLKVHHLEALHVCVIGKVRYLIVYNATKGFPISLKHAQQIRQAVLTMTRVPYTGPFTLIEPESIEDTPTILIKKIPHHNSP